MTRAATGGDAGERTPASAPDASRTWRAALLALVAWASSCAGYDAKVFDERLRAATVDRYIEAIERQFGGLAPAELEPGMLAKRYRDAAIAAATPAAFYGVLREMLADLDDPHASLRVSPRFWSGPVAEPEWTRFVRASGQVMVGMPEGSIRTEAELEAARSRWVEAVGGASVEALDTEGLADVLRASAVYGGAGGFDAALEPLVWMPVEAIDGVPVESPHDAELLSRGALLSTAVFTVGPGEGVALIRNAGVFEDDTEVGVRRRLDPFDLAALIDPGGARLRDSDRTRRGPFVIPALWGRGPFRGGRPLELPEASADPFRIEAWILPAGWGRTVGYLRIGSFRPRGEQTSSRPEDGPSMEAALAASFAGLRGQDTLILDLTGNPGGYWQEAGRLLSYFLDPAVETVPHEVVTISETGTWLLKLRTRHVQRLGRSDVERVHPDRILVLVDQDTASAGEIVASALRGLEGAQLFGETTAGAEYSTGHFSGPDGSKMTIGLSGGMVPPLEGFQGRGLKPDVEVGSELGEGHPFIQLLGADLWAERGLYRWRVLRVALQHVTERSLGTANP